MDLSSTCVLYLCITFFHLTVLHIHKPEHVQFYYDHFYDQSLNKFKVMFFLCRIMENILKSTAKILV